jgi:membrane-bound lytic murein transglycosylase F
MHRNFISNVVVPILFVLVATLSALFAAKFTHQEPIKQAPTEPQTEHIEEEVITPEHLISEYDNIFKEMGEKYELDWLLLAAIANSESRFQANAKSHVGARGLMQIMPHVARNMGYSKNELYDVRTNVEIAAQLLIENKKMLHLPGGFDEEEGLKFLLACYNAGYSRIDDARDVAKYFDADTKNWNIVGLFLSWLSDPEFSGLEVVESGPFYGSQETLDYVEKVTETYRKYQEISKV